MECWGECFFLGMFGHLCLEVEHHKCSTVVAIVNSQLETEPDAPERRPRFFQFPAAVQAT